MNDGDLVPTRSSRLKGAKPQVEVAIFNSYKSKKKQNAVEEGPKEAENAPKTVELDMKKARFDIIKFGMSGLKGKAKRKVNIELAISLGAKAPKNKKQNYKKLKHVRQVQLKKEQEQKELHQIVVNTPTLKKPKHNKRKNENIHLLDGFGKVSAKDLPKKKKK